ncbi:hypothetical protein DERP_007105 [Dermatophagoides pteronyssinus]|uniref:Uncharacterized protein n=1 Tax=Dermatophagoides pteronyssinus TaxID=6956 RepID=A0ABQ8JUM9_DERPT|nr:hypothetical protein DERP_007105 [Dermatophagoides pteronyssinus]
MSPDYYGCSTSTTKYTGKETLLHKLFSNCNSAKAKKRSSYIPHPKNKPDKPDDAFLGTKYSSKENE